jgi:hypothetical protein
MDGWIGVVSGECALTNASDDGVFKAAAMKGRDDKDCVRYPHSKKILWRVQTNVTKRYRYP